MIVTVRVDILRVVVVVLEKWQGSDDVATCREEVDQRSSIAIALQAGAELVPSALAPVMGDGRCSRVVGPPEHRAVPHEGFCYAGSALDGEGAWVKHAISDVLPPTVLAGLARDDPGSNFLGGELQADVRCTCSVPLPVNDECAARNGAAIVLEVVLNDGQPMYGKGRCGTPVHRTEFRPVRRNRERVAGIWRRPGAVCSRPAGVLHQHVEPIQQRQGGGLYREGCSG